MNKVKIKKKNLVLNRLIYYSARVWYSYFGEIYLTLGMKIRDI